VLEGLKISIFHLLECHKVCTSPCQSHNQISNIQVVATSIQFYYGDEILRKKRREVKVKLQQQLELQPKKPLTHSQYGNPVPDIFDETFVREADYVNEDILSPLENKEG
jgi:hypothetical protein